MALSNVRTCAVGPLTVTHGTYTHTSGDASESVGVSGEIIALIVNPQTATGSNVDMESSAYSQSLSGQVRTVTFLQNAGISAGTFMIITRHGV